MMITSERLQYLLTQYADNACTRIELLELFRGIEQCKNDNELQSVMDVLWANLKPGDALPLLPKQQIFNNIIKQVTVVPMYKRTWFKVSAAAAILLLVGTTYLTFNHQQKQQFASVKEFKNDVMPGTSKATLTLANGSKIILTDAKSGPIASQGKANLVKLVTGDLVYNSDKTNNATSSTVLYNTMSTPRGGKYDLTLSDGTKVWLNASSSITYPVVFVGNERDVIITGEAYFEVAKNKNMPFHVKTGNQTIEVLGTHFNVNAYADEGEIKTTLLEGKVKVLSTASGGAVLLPGQQSIFRPSSQSISVQYADTEEAIAWKNGYFQFEKSDIQTVMRQLSRWYDVDIEFEGKTTQDKFGGSIPRDAPLSQVLRTLEQSMIHFKIDGKKVTVME